MEQTSELCSVCGLRPHLYQRTKCRQCRGSSRSRATDGPAPPAPAPEKLKCLAVVNDVHVPDQDRRAVNVCMGILEDVHPDIIILNGDIGEFGAVSLHGSGALEKLGDDYDVVHRFLAGIRERHPDATIKFKAGNHETRIERFVQEKAPQLEGGFRTVQEGLRLDSLGIDWIEEGHENMISYGPMDILHGHEIFPKQIPINHANRAADRLGRKGRTVIYGHTHDYQVHNRRGIETAAAIGVGCLRTGNPKWVRGNPVGWTLGFLVSWFTENSTSPYHVTIKNHSAIWRGVRYVGQE